MPCDPVDLGNGRAALVCSRGGRRSSPCRYCGRASSRLCDFPVTRGLHKGTCDAPLCDRCTSRIAGNGDLCRAHAPLWDAAIGKPRVGPGAELP